MYAIYESEKYFTTLENLKNTLEEYGVAIIPSLLSEEECKEMEEGMWNTLETWTKDWEATSKKNLYNI